MKLSLLLVAALAVPVSSLRKSSTGAASDQVASQTRRRLAGVVGLTVLDGDRGVETRDNSWDFMALTDGVEIDLDNLGDLTNEDARGVHWGTARINIRATTSGSVGSVTFDYDDGDFFSTVQVGNNRFDTLMWEEDFVFTNGYHTLKVTGWSGSNGNGNRLEMVDVGFTIVSAVAEGAENVPEFTSNWQNLPRMPIRISESNSAVIDGNLVVFNGFTSLSSATNRVFAKDLSNNSSPWRELNSYPISQGATHIPVISHGTKAWLLGGYLGRSARPPPDMDECFELDITGDRGDGSWRTLPSLPEGRGAGAAFYVEHMNTLVYTLGARRSRSIGTVDKLTTWWLDLDNESSGWVQKRNGPYLGNHIKEAVAKDCDGNEHYFVFGGQSEEDEKDHNLDDVWEYFPDADRWERRASMIMPRGHLASAEYSCGFVIIAGVTDFYSDEKVLTSDISYYDIPTNTWSRIGDSADARNSYNCGVHNDALYCTGGFSQDLKMRRLTVPDRTPTAPTPRTTAEPTATPPRATPRPTPAAGPGPSPGVPLYKLNCGGPGRSSDGWESDDPYVISGITIDRTIALGDDAFDSNGPDFIYNTERRDTSADDIEYDFPDVLDGAYQIEFLFAEVQRSTTRGDRIFSFSAEGSAIPEITDFDIYQQVGFGVPITVVVDVTVSDGDGLQIKSSVRAENAKIQGLIITPKARGPSLTPIPPMPTAVPTVSPTASPSQSPAMTPTTTSTPDTLTPTRTPIATPPAPSPTPVEGNIVYSINCGGDAEFPGWENDDAYVSAGRWRTRTRFDSTSTNYSELFMYNTERKQRGDDPLDYEFPLANGMHDVSIFLIESQMDGAGMRSMDVLLEDVLVLERFDVFDFAGAKDTPFVYTIPDVSVTDGSLSISFVGVVDDAKVNGIVVTEK